MFNIKKMFLFIVSSATLLHIYLFGGSLNIVVSVVFILIIYSNTYTIFRGLFLSIINTPEVRFFLLLLFGFVFIYTTVTLSLDASTIYFFINTIKGFYVPIAVIFIFYFIEVI